MSLHDLLTRWNDAGEVWSQGMLRACWQGGLAVGVAWLACTLLRRRVPAGLRCLVWWLVCLKLAVGLAVLPPVEVSFVPGSSRSLPLPVPPPLIAVQLPQPATPTPMITDVSPSAGNIPSFTPPGRVVVPALPVPVALPLPSPRALLLALWALGVLAGLSRLTWQVAAACRLVRQAQPLTERARSAPSTASEEADFLQGLESEIALLPRAFGLRLSSQTQSPLLIGLLRPTIVLPVAPTLLTPEERRMALAHELAHVRRGDLWLGLLPTVTRLLFFFYPLAWLACREFALTREEACDAEAVQTVPVPLDVYGNLLLKFAAPRSLRSAVTLGAASPFAHLQRRLQMLQHVSLRPVSPTTRRRMRLIACACALIGGLSLVPWSFVGAQETVASFGEDARLDQKTLVNVEGLPVEEVLALISRKTGVTLLADRDTRDDKVICFGPSRPLRDILTDLAALFGDRWTQNRGEDGKTVFRLTRSPRIRDYENRLADQMNARMMAELDKQTAALKETPEQLQQRPADDMIRRILSHDEGRLATQFYSLLSAQQKQQLFAEGHTDSVPFKALTPEQQQPLRQWFDARIKAQQKMAAENNTTVKIGNTTYSSFIQVSRPEDLEQGIARFDINGEAGSEDTNILLRLGTNQMPLRQFVIPQRSLLPAHGDPYTARPAAAHATLPPAAEVGALLPTLDWRDKLHQLADRTQIPIMADYYRAATPVAAHNQAPAEAAAPDIAALDALCRPEAYLWWTRGKTLLLRKREWYLHRQYETPDRWTRETARRLGVSKGVPTYADLLRLSELTPRQITGLQLAHEFPTSNRGTDGLLNLLALVKPRVFNERKALAGEPKVSDNHRSVLDPSEADAIVVNESGGLPESLRHYLTSINSPVPADLTGLKIKTFYSYMVKRNDNTPAHKALMAALQKQLELRKTATPESEESKRMEAEVTKLMGEDLDQQRQSKGRDERFVYINMTAILLQQGDDPASPQSSTAFSTPADTANSGAPLRVTSVHLANNYHVILPRSLAGDRSDRTRIESEGVPATRTKVSGS